MSVMMSGSDVILWGLLFPDHPGHNVGLACLLHPNFD